MSEFFSKLAEQRHFGKTLLFSNPEALARKITVSRFLANVRAYQGKSRWCYPTKTWLRNRPLPEKNVG
jgi:hypothetical protein